MKKKILIGFITGLFVVVMMFNLKINTQSNDNISLKNIVALSTANAEDTSVSCNVNYHGPQCGWVYLGMWYYTPTYYSYAYYF